MRIASSGYRLHPATARLAIPALLLLLVQVALYLWMAPRGFDFTDEAYYFHNFLHWREFTGTVTFFGAYFEWPFRAMNDSIAGIRILSLILVLVSSAILMHSVLRFSLWQKVPGGAEPAAAGMNRWWYLVAPMASGMLYFGYFSTLRAPSYNLLSLCSMAIATACLLRVLEPGNAGRRWPRAGLVYGIALGACFLSKATTAVAMVLLHAAFFVAVNKEWSFKRLAEILVLVTAGFAANFIVLTMLFPGWLDSLMEGIAIVRVRSGTYSTVQLLKGVQWELQHALAATGPWPWLLGLAFILALRRIRQASKQTISLIALGLVGVSVALIAGEHRSKIWLFVMGATAVGLWNLERIGSASGAERGNRRSELALMALLFFSPLAFSFGTNMSVFAHSAIASVFVFSAVYLRLYKLAQNGRLTDGVLAASLLLLCIPALVSQWLAFTDAKYTYRQLSPLGAQHAPVLLGLHAVAVQVDARFGKTLNDILSMSKTAGFLPGQHVLDLAGGRPGVLFAMGANPLGTPWMLGGEPGSVAAAARIIEKIDPQSLRTTWLLTSADNPGRIHDWESMLARRIGSGSHVMAGSIEFPRLPAVEVKGPETITLQLWKPVIPASTINARRSTNSPE